MAETQRIPSLALPDEPPEDVLDLARTFPGTRLLVLISAQGAHWPADLDAGRPGSECFRRVDLGPPTSGPSGDDLLEDVRVYEIVVPMSGPYTPKRMEAARGATDARDSRFDGLHAEASAAVGSSANTIRGVRERYREAYADALARWQDLRDELDAVGREPRISRPRLVAPGPPETQPADEDALTAAEAGAGDARLRALRSEVESLAGALEGHRSALAKLELLDRTLSRMWLFLEPGDSALVAADDLPGAEGNIAMRIVEAQEAERARLAQEIHDGPAQALTNAIFQASTPSGSASPTPLAPRPRSASCATSFGASSRTCAGTSASSAPAARRAGARRRDRGGGRAICAPRPAWP